MRHAVLARHALLTSLGLLPLACGGAVDTAPGEGGAAPREGGTAQTDGVDVNLHGARGPSPINACGASTPLPSNGLLQDTVAAPRQLSAVDTGLVGCDNGVIHRPEPVTCQSGLPRPLPPAPNDTEADAGGGASAPAMTQVEFLYRGSLPPLQNGGYGACSADAECDAKPYGYCAVSNNGDQLAASSDCVYGCVEDADCGVGFLCQCGDPVGQCIPAECLSDADCGDKLCAAWFGENICGTQHAFACQTAEDECATLANCEEGGACVVEGGARVCLPWSGLVCGRPFLVRNTARLAELVAGGGWARGDMAAIEQGNADEGLRVGEHWARAGLMEHASIAAFARFALQLLHLGAPRELLEASQRAMQDETEHARLCFGLAERYLRAPVGAGPLPMEGALLDLEFERIVVLCFREGCVGETVAALEASVARDHATDAQVQHVLDRIAPDEQRHAELAWKFIRWALRENPTATRALLGQELRRLDDELTAFAPPADAGAGIPEHGVLGEHERASIRRAALREVVLPCAEAVLGAASASAARAEPATTLSAWPA